MHIADDDIGGARVRRMFSRGNEMLRAGHRLTGDEVRAIPIANRRALIDAGYLEVWPTPSADENAERHLVYLGRERYAVIAGVKLNPQPLSKAEAVALAGHDKALT